METIAQLQEALAAVCRERTGDPAAEVVGLAPLGGHAGFTFGFTLRRAGGEEQLVLRLAPPGARAEGPADVERQGRLLRALAETPVPVAPVRFLGGAESPFGRPFHIVARLPGDTVRAWEERTPPEAALARMADAGLSALVALHRLDWRRVAAAHGPPLDPREDVERWDGLCERSADPELLALAPRVRRLLLERAPPAPRIGLFHGDFQWSNLLFAGERLVAVLDWELAAVGPVLNDLGWLAVFSDPGSWSCQGPPVVPPVPGPDELVARYRELDGSDPGELAWYRALAGYKFAAITGFNLMLHRRDKRRDALWELLAPSTPRLLERALEVLG